MTRAFPALSPAGVTAITSVGGASDGAGKTSMGSFLFSKALGTF